MNALSAPLAVRHPGLAGMFLITLESSAASAPLSSFLDGLLHPLLDPGHLLAVISIGFAGAQLGGRSRWSSSALCDRHDIRRCARRARRRRAEFDAVAITAGPAIALLALAKVRLALAIVTTLAGTFALFHGVADSPEINRSGGACIPGFILANAAVVSVGTLLGEWLLSRVHWALLRTGH
jgi:urease accessory protein